MSSASLELRARRFNRRVDSQAGLIDNQPRRRLHTRYTGSEEKQTISEEMIGQYRSFLIPIRSHQNYSSYNAFNQNNLARSVCSISTYCVVLGKPGMRWNGTPLKAFVDDYLHRLFFHENEIPPGGVLTTIFLVASASAAVPNFGRVELTEDFAQRRKSRLLLEN